MEHNNKYAQQTITSPGRGYSPLVGFLYVFNLIVGTGALTMANAFSEAGWLLSLIAIIILAIVSYITVTFMIEAMSIANYAVKIKRRNDAAMQASDDDGADDEKSCLIRNEDLTEITERVEMGQMSAIFFNKWGRLLFYICTIVYLYGDLTIYATAVAKSFLDVICTYHGQVNCSDVNHSIPIINDSARCWDASPTLARQDVYRILVAIFAVTLGPFLFFNVQKTVYMQIFTAVNRWIAFICIIVLSAMKISENKHVRPPPKVFDITGVPTLFGVCVYSFMCHHSLPSLVTPIKRKKNIFKLLAVDYSVILVFYCLVSFLAIFAFVKVKDLITLNFAPSPCAAVDVVLVLRYYLMLFPVFTLSTNFPIIGITLRNNLKNLIYKTEGPYHFVVDRLLFPLMALLPPIAVALATSDVSFLVGITGSYAGAGIQYVIPASLVFFARRSVYAQSPVAHESPFRHSAWVLLVIIWAGICWILVTVYNVIKGVKS